MINLLFSIIFTNLLYLLAGKIYQNNKNKNKFDYIIESSIYGTIVIAFLALFINFFFPLSPKINTILYMLIIIYFFLKKHLLNKKDFYYLALSVFLTLSLLFFSKVNTPDAFLYHLPYTQILNENKLIIGLSNIHFRFGHVSIIQYLAAINFNELFNNFSITIPLASLVSFLYIYFIYEILLSIKNKKIDLNTFFCSFILIYISVNMTRYSGFGNDTPAHLLFFFLISKFLKYKSSIENFKNIFLTSIYIFLNKITLGFVFLFPFVLFIKNKYGFQKIFFSFSTLFLFLWILKNILTTSCIIYPINLTCFKNLEWNDTKEIEEQYILGEAWSKGWPENKNNNITPKDFIKNFTWIKAWSQKHFKYIYKIVLIYLSIILLVFFIIKFNQKGIEERERLHDETLKKLTIFASCFLGVIFFIIKFPLYRYGYSYLIGLFAITASVFIIRYNVQIFYRYLKSIILIFFLIIISKPIIRLIKFHETQTVIPKIFYTIKKNNQNENYKKINLSNSFVIYESNTVCMYKLAPCTNILKSNIEHKKIFSYDFIIIRKK